MLNFFMDLNLDSILMPIFRMIASPGLGNPHSPYEASLMSKGIKPVAILSSEDIDTSLQGEIDNGSVVQINTHDFEERYRIYCTQSEIENATDAAKILEGFIQDPKHFLQESDIALKKTFNIKDDTAIGRLKALEHVRRFEVLEINGQITPEANSLLEGTSSILLPIRIFPDEGMDTDLEKQVTDGKLVTADFSKTQTLHVIAQSKNQKEGEELDARYYGDGTGYSDLKGDEWNARIGDLLGYTSNDIAWSNGTKYQNPWVKKIMFATRDFRAEIRHKVMLHDAPRHP